SVVKGFLAANPQAQENWLLHSVLGGLYERTMQHDQAKSERQMAIGILQKLIDDGSKEVEVHRYLASLLRTEKRYDEALRLVNKAMSLPSDDDMAARDLHFLLAEIYYETQQEDLCEKELRKVLEYGPDWPTANNFLGYFYAERGKHLDEAERLIEKALKAEPDNGAYLDSLGWVWYRQAMQDNDSAKVKRALDKLKEASSKYDDPVIREHIGDVYHGMGDLDKAEVEWRKSLQLWERRPNEPPGPDGVRHKLEQLLKLKTAGKKDEK
ncbi:MAG: tetratricopeptide repeat protein, partial [Planctomycetes bacterium]|nr:tetratricopeptide repeat protein [Planctomycetota bacterium]